MSSASRSSTRFAPWNDRTVVTGGERISTWPRSDPSTPQPGHWVPPTGPAAGAWDPAAAPRVAPDARKRSGWATFWTVLFWIDLGFIGLNAVLSITLALLVQTGQLDPSVLGGGGGDLDAQRALLWLESSLSLAMFGLIPLAWVFFTRHRPFEGTVRFFNLRDPVRSLLPGAGIAVGAVLAVVLVTSALAALGVQEPSPAADRLIGAINWPLAVFIAFVAGFGEEILFRGVLQKRLGVWGQGVLFGALHLANGFTAFFITGLIGLGFGYLVKRGTSLWVPITAHFLYDLILLGSVLLFPEFVEEATEGGEAIVRRLLL